MYQAADEARYSQLISDSAQSSSYIQHLPHPIEEQDFLLLLHWEESLLADALLLQNAAFCIKLTLIVHFIIQNWPEY